MISKRQFLLIGIIFVLCAIPLQATAKAPNLIGEWEGRLELVAYEDFTNSDSEPVFSEMTGTIIITQQQDKVFAGIMSGNGNSTKLTGVLLPGNEFEMQACDAAGKTVFRGKLSGSVMRGSFTNSDDTNVADTPAMISGYFIGMKK
jgi:hypothetical protein